MAWDDHQNRRRVSFPQLPHGCHTSGRDQTPIYYHNIGVGRRTKGQDAAPAGRFANDLHGVIYKQQSEV